MSEYNYPSSKTICVTNHLLCHDDFLKRLEVISHCNIDKIILREKDLSDTLYYELATKVYKLIGGRCDLVLSHRNNLNIPHAEKFGLQHSYNNFKGKLNGYSAQGVSIHAKDEAINAQKLGADYLIAGHIFHTDCKKDLAPRGLEFLKSVTESVAIPVYAIGGITPENSKAVRECGARICVMSSLMQCSLKQIPSLIQGL